YRSLRAHRDRHSFPPRRSSELDAVDDAAAAVAGGVARIGDVLDALRVVRAVRIVGIAALSHRAHVANGRDRARRVVPALHAPGRSEEHTSELQSREISYAVFCL